MKRSLWILFAVLLALAAFLVSRGARSSVESPPATQKESRDAPAVADHAREVVLSKAPPAETPLSRVETSPAASKRDTVSPSAASSAADTSAPPPLVDLSTAASTTVETALTDDERAFFDKKYASSSRDARREAREKLESFVSAQKAGTLEKSQVVSNEEILAMRQEIAWLVDNPSP